jgi:hypothetical protein
MVSEENKKRNLIAFFEALFSIFSASIKKNFLAQLTSIVQCQLLC